MMGMHEATLSGYLLGRRPMPKGFEERVNAVLDLSGEGGAQERARLRPCSGFPGPPHKARHWNACGVLQGRCLAMRLTAHPLAVLREQLA